MSRSKQSAPPTRPGAPGIITHSNDLNSLPILLTANEVADLLRTSRKSVYAMIERGQLPGVIRLGRRLLIRRDELVDWLDRSHAPSSKERGR